MPVAVVSVGGGGWSWSFLSFFSSFGAVVALVSVCAGGCVDVGGGGACVDVVVVDVFAVSVTVAVVVGPFGGGVAVEVDEEDIDGFGCGRGCVSARCGTGGRYTGGGVIGGSVPATDPAVSVKVDAVAGSVKLVVVSAAVFVLGGITIGSPGAPTVDDAPLAAPS